MKRAVIGTIKLYQAGISPFLGDNCRFYPSCSHYGVEAFEKLPFFKALGKTAWRILRCNPFNRGGFDPVIKE
jgi:hypothetical protein